MRYSKKILEAVYPEYISEKRRPAETPDALCLDGKASMGTFANPFRLLNPEDCKGAVKGVARSLYPFRLKQWEAFEISFAEGFLVGAVYSVGMMMTNILIFYDKINNKVVSNQTIGMPKKDRLAKTLVDSGAYNEIGRIKIYIKNNFEKGECKVFANSRKTGRHVGMDVDVRLKSVAMPSICVMPLGENRPLYSQKELFKAVGNLRIGDAIYQFEDGLAIIDDHKGFYPYNMRYDWVTGAGETDEGTVAFNLTANQVTNSFDYNENYLWLNGELHPLPPIKFDKVKDVWRITDDYGAVDVTFKIDNSFRLKLNALAIKIDYTAPFGYLEGTIKDLEGNPHAINGLFGMGEDKNYRM